MKNEILSITNKIKFFLLSDEYNQKMFNYLYRIAVQTKKTSVNPEEIREQIPILDGINDISLSTLKVIRKEIQEELIKNLNYYTTSIRNESTYYNITKMLYAIDCISYDYEKNTIFNNRNLKLKFCMEYLKMVKSAACTWKDYEKYFGNLKLLEVIR